MEKRSGRSQKIFLLITILFTLGLIIVGYDISQRTSFPGSKKYLKESIAPSDTTKFKNRGMESLIENKADKNPQ